MIRHLVFVLLLISILGAQTKDSVRTYKLQEITVRSGEILEPKSVTQINFNRIENSDAGSISEIGKFIPSLKVQTNSRGETLFFIRGSGERQISLFFDGIPMNIPWDNRIDLSLVPTNAIGQISITKGVPSITYGANTLGGVINIFSKKYLHKNSGKLSAQLGLQGEQKYSACWLNGNDSFSYLTSLNFNRSDGYDLPSSFKGDSENSDKRRTNSYNKSLGAFARLTYTPSVENNYNLSFSYNSSEKGVPPETDVSSPRYWQYPEWKNLTFSFNGSNKFGENNNSLLTYLFSANNFNMQINQYTDHTFSVFDDVEKDNDFTLSGRVILTQFFGTSHLLKFTLGGFSTLHEEKFLETNFAVTEQYAQNIFSGGVEYEYISDKITGIIGVGLDASSTPKTGDKPSSDPLTDLSFNSSLAYMFSNDLSVNINLGRKTRFPTLRESFSGALGKFVLNPNLKPELVNSIEAGVTYSGKNLYGNLNFFASYYSDGIVKAVINADNGKSKFQRINKDNIRILGIELISCYNLSNNFNCEVNFTFLNSFAKNSFGEFKDTLEYKPEIIAGLNFDYSPIEKINTTLELNYIGREYGLQGGNEYFQTLPEYLLFNIRASYQFSISGRLGAEFFIRINNLFDRLYYTQWSLPEAGRQIYGGLILDI